MVTFCMGRHASLVPRRDSKKNLWVVSLPPGLSPNGRRKREYFRNKKEADQRSEQLIGLEKHSRRAAREAGPELVKTAVNYDELFRDIYGFDGGLAQACEDFIRRLDKERKSLSFGELLENYERDNCKNWRDAYTTKWGWFQRQVSELAGKPTVLLSSSFWVEWLDQRAKIQGWSPQTFNEVAGLLSSVWNYGVALESVGRNPILGVKRQKVRRTVKAIYTVEQVEKLMHCTWEYDRQMIPYFAMALFAGLRPDEGSEISNLLWEDVDFDHGNIRVGATFDTKTGTKRFVEMEANLREWLLPWRGSSGPLAVTNLRRRRQWITRGRYQSPEGTPEKEWTPLVPYGPEARDITRHTYGSFLEGKYRDRNKVMANMGHTDTKTFEQHYRNARSPQEAERFWSIVPPVGKS